MRQPVVILEGADGSGKTTLYQAFRRATNYQVLTIDRWIGSQLVYDAINKRQNKEPVWHAEERRMMTIYDPFLWVCWAPEVVLEQRLLAKADRMDNYVEANRRFRQYWEGSRFDKKWLLNTTDTVQSCVDHMIRELEVRDYHAA